MFSIVIPCYNQGRFLTDCLESLAAQTRFPAEVILVNDGSTDTETNRLVERLVHYSYPFPIRVLTQENRGLPAARNAGIRASRGEYILPLDGDDKLFPTAIEDFERFFARHPNVDICYPDVLMHGTTHYRYLAPYYNRWRHTQHNWFVPSTAVRRRVFASGHFFCEEMRRGYEDWEFWLRTCALGSFQAAPLRKRVFAYRKWGYSMLAATNHDEQIAQIRRFHTKLGLWSPSRERELRTAHAPGHLWIYPGPLHPELGQPDFAAVPVWEVEARLRTDTVSRFVWFGDLPTQDLTTLTLVVLLAADVLHVPLYVFCKEGSDSPYLMVLDRLAVAEMQYVDIFADRPTSRCLRMHTRGNRHPLPVTVREESAWPVPVESPLTILQQLPSRPVLPDGFAVERRRGADGYYFFRRDFFGYAWPRPAVSKRVLAIVVPNLVPGPEADFVRSLLREDALRARFDRVYLVTIDPGETVNIEDFEDFLAGLYPLGLLPRSPKQKVDLLFQLLETTGGSEVLVVNTSCGFDVIPRLRGARLPVRITAAFPGPAKGEAAALAEGPLRRLASEYANLVDRVATGALATTGQLLHLLYFPPSKVETFPTDRSGRVPDLIHWLFPDTDSIQDRGEEVFGSLSRPGDTPGSPVEPVVFNELKP
jgi:hypothetical protein